MAQRARLQTWDMLKQHLAVRWPPQQHRMQVFPVATRTHSSPAAPQ